MNAARIVDAAKSYAAAAVLRVGELLQMTRTYWRGGLADALSRFSSEEL